MSRTSFWRLPLARLFRRCSHCCRSLTSPARSFISWLKLPSSLLCPRNARRCRARYRTLVKIVRSEVRACSWSAAVCNGSGVDTVDWLQFSRSSCSTANWCVWLDACDWNDSRNLQTWRLVRVSWLNQRDARKRLLNKRNTTLRADQLDNVAMGNAETSWVENAWSEGCWFPRVED